MRQKRVQMVFSYFLGLRAQKVDTRLGKLCELLFYVRVLVCAWAGRSGFTRKHSRERMRLLAGSLAPVGAGSRALYPRSSHVRARGFAAATFGAMSILSGGGL